MVLAEPFQKMLTYINGIIIGLTDIIRAFVPVNKEVSFANQITQVGELNEELEKTKGNLLSFDKFEALSSTETTGVGNIEITQALTEELRKQQELYDSITNAMTTAGNKATEIAKKIRDWFIKVDIDGKFVGWTDKAKDLLSVITALVGVKMISKIIKWSSVFIKGLTDTTTSAGLLNTALKLLQSVGIFLIIYSITELVTKWDDLDEKQKTLYISLTVLGVAMTIFSNKTIMQTLLKALTTATSSFLTLNSVALGTKLAFLGIGTAIGLGLGYLLEQAPSGIRLVVGLIVGLTGAVIAAAVAFGTLQSTLTLGIAAAGIVAGIVAITSAIKEATNTGNLDWQYKANGGIIDTRGGDALAVVNEYGSNELVYSNNARQVEVSNQQSLEQSFLSALLKYHNITADDKAKISVEIEDKSSFAEFTRKITPNVLKEGRRIGML